MKISDFNKKANNYKLMNYKKIYEEALKIRFFEKKLLDLFDKGLLNGTTHTCIGQEIIPVILSKYLNSNDSVFSNHPLFFFEFIVKLKFLFLYENLRI